MWNGAVLFGDDWMAYHGATDQNSRHAHSAAQLAFGLGGPVSIIHAGGTVQADALFIFPGTRWSTKAATASRSCCSRCSPPWRFGLPAGRCVRSLA
jgi:hypothetical protein